MKTQTVKNKYEKCAKCGKPQHPKCDGDGWLEPIGPCVDGSYITTRPCMNDRPYYE